ncbi:MAG TPA: peptidylprolyl isomerase [Kofleriaceae bacterium]|jgi:parvulin-like peptidyl-prolyl isomerase
MRIYHVAFAVLLAASCDQGKSKLDDLKGHPHPGAMAGSATAGSASVVDITSKDILARTNPADEVDVEWVLIAWKELDATTYHGQIDKRAATRSNADAAKLALETLDKLKADPSQLDTLVKTVSEQPGGGQTDPITINKSIPLPPEFKSLVDLSLRLQPKEAGIVRTPLGYHVIERVPPPPPDPLESADILARPAEPGPVTVQHVLVGWKDVPAAKRIPLDPRAQARTKADADKLATEILAKARSGADFKDLMKQYSEDPGSKDNGRTMSVSETENYVEPFKKLALRLKEGEVGLVKSPFGWHIIKRVPAPPPDPLESADILKRAPVTDKAKVKHILLNWADNNPKDPRAQKRSRAELEALVKDTVAKLKAGAKIEDLMKQLSEDPGSAKKGDSYDVTPDAGLVEPFKNLSLRLKVGEVGVVKTEFGIHIIKRVE